MREILHAMQVVYQLSHRGTPAGQAESFWFIQGKRYLFPVRQGYSKLSTMSYNVYRLSHVYVQVKSSKLVDKH